MGATGEDEIPDVDGRATAVDLQVPAPRDRTRTVIDPVRIQATDETTTGIVAPEADLVGSPAFMDRYERVARIGEGGMGEVAVYADRQIGRHVALKAMHPEQATLDTARARFLREARVQGQLEHPSIVPVYDMGADDGGQIYFTMQRIHGVSLEEVLEDLETGEPEMLARFSQRRLLTDFSQVCLAIDFAHRRGILHRDLKPANIMLGDFGEVFVIDWGLAKVDDGVDLTREMSVGKLEVGPTLRTAAGAVMGTPGYMSPEQMRGQHRQLTPASDVYSLGALLFELVTLQPLHPRTSGPEIYKNTLKGVEARPSVRHPQLRVPSELETMIVRAVAQEPGDRYATARELNDDIERFLDGQRDDERRRELAARHAHAAQSAAEEAMTSVESRRRAIREVGKALALDPDNRAAAEILGALLDNPPEERPPEVRRVLEAEDEARAKWAGGLSALGYASMLFFLPFAIWMGVESWWALLPVLVLGGSSALMALGIGIRGAPQGVTTVLSFISTLAIAATTSFFGPLVLTPAMLAVNTTAYAVFLTGIHRLLAIFAGAAAMVLILLLSLAGILPGGYSFGPEGMTIAPGALVLPEVPSIVLLFAASLVTIIMPAFLVAKLRDDLTRAEEKLHLSSWHFRELLPEALESDDDVSG